MSNLEELAIKQGKQIEALEYLIRKVELRQVGEAADLGAHVGERRDAIGVVLDRCVEAKREQEEESSGIDAERRDERALTPPL